MPLFAEEGIWVDAGALTRSCLTQLSQLCGTVLSVKALGAPAAEIAADEVTEETAKGKQPYGTD